MPYLGNFVGGVGSSSESSFSLLSIDDGSESAPSIAYKDDANLGIYSPAQDTLGFVTNGSEALRINSSGQVSIGTITGIGSVAKLTLEGSAALTNFDQTLMVVDSDTDDAIGNGGFIGLGGYVNNITRTLAGIRGIKSSSGSNFNGDLGLYTRQNSVADLDEKVRITSDGKVGIGTTSPAVLLEVSKSTNPEVNIYSTSGNNSTATLRVKGARNSNDNSNVSQIIFENNANTYTMGRIATKMGSGNSTDQHGELIFSTVSGGTLSEVMKIDKDGKVGIGEIDPATTLEIKSDAHDQTTATIPTLRITNDDGSATEDDITGSVEFFTEDSSDPNHISGFMRNLSETDAGVNYSLIFGTKDATVTGDATEKVRITSNGRVGIGMVNPAGLLDIKKNVSTAYDATDDDAQRAGTATLSIRNDDGTTNSFAQLTFDTAGTDQSIARIVAIRSGTASNHLAFVTESGNTKSEKFRITAGGNIGIGTESPETSLHIKDGTASPMITLENPNNNTGTRATYIRHKFDDGFGGEILCLRPSGAAATGAEISFRVGGLNAANQKMVIKSTGNVGIGTASPNGKLHISSGTSGDANLILEADTDNNGESDNPNIIFRQDGGLDLGAIGMNLTNSSSVSPSNELYVAASSAGAAIVFATGTTNGYTNASERFRITSDGYVGIGGDFSTTAIRNKLHITGGDMNLDNNKYIGFNIYNDGSWKQVGSGNGAVVKHHNTDGLQLYTGPDSENGAGGAASVSARLTIDNSGNVGIGTTSPSQKLNVNGGSLLVDRGTVTTVNSYAGRFDLTVDNVNADMVYNIRTDTTMNNTGTTSSDREQGAIYNLITDNSIGDTSHEHRLWTIWNDINVYGHADLAYGTYNDLRCYSPSSVPAFSHLRGIYNLVQVQQNTDNNTSAQYNNVWASYNISQSTSSYNGTIGTIGGVYARANFGSSATTSVSNVYAVLAEIDNDAGVNTTVTGRSALFYGHYVRTGATQFGYLNDPYGILIEDDVRSYHRGDLGIGSGTEDPATELEVSGTITLTNVDQENAIRTNSDGQLEFLSNAASNNTVAMTIDDDTQRVHVGPIDDGIGEFNVYTGTSSNNSGIELHVDTMGNDIISYNRGTNTYKDLDISSSTLTLNASGGAYLRTDTSGNIGIGTNFGETLTQKVKIVGNIDINGGVLTSQLTAVINDDDYLDVIMPVKGGLIAISSFTTYDTYPQPTGTGIVYFDAGTSRGCSIMSSANSTGNGALVASTSTSTTVTDFTDNRTTISVVNTTGKIRIINRSGSSRQYKLTLL